MAFESWLTSGLCQAVAAGRLGWSRPSKWRMIDGFSVNCAVFEFCDPAVSKGFEQSPDQI
jgi:hypothetical protein